jgi:Ca-activated chloride channel homolog
MSLLVPAALAFGLLIPVILLFYFMRPRRQERVVGSTLLWQQALQDLQASRPWQRLRITPLLLLQVLAAIIIVLVLARPATFFRSPIGGDTIIILQASASMQATDVPPSRFEAARSHVAALIDGLGPADHLSIIAMARTPQVVISSSADKSQLSSALARVRVTNEDADLGQALSLAGSLAAGHADAHILIIGDGHVLTPEQLLEVPVPVSYLEIGTAAPNAALLSLASSSIQGNLVALAQLANYSRQPRSIPVELYADGKLVGVQTISLAAGASGVLQWGPLPAATRFLHAHIILQDAMRVDHEAWAIVGGSMHGRVLLVTHGNSFLEAALRVQPNIDLFETTPAQYAPGGTYDLTVFDGYVPPLLPPGALFFVNPPGGSYIFGKSGPQIAVSHISAGSDSQNVLNEVDLSSIHALHFSHQLTPASGMQAVIVTPETPLLITGEGGNRRIAALSFDLHDSDLPLQPSFPVLVYNLVNWFLPPPVPGSGQIAPGTPVNIAPWPAVTRITITAPGQQPVTVAPPFPAAAYDEADAPGIYSVTQFAREPGGGARQGAFAVNLFDPLQSNLAPAARLPVSGSTPFHAGGPGVSHVLQEIWPWIAALLLLVLCTEWWIFSSGYTLRAAAPLRKNTLLRRGGILHVRTEREEIQRALQRRYRAVMKRAARVSKRLRRLQKGMSNADL